METRVQDTIKTERKFINFSVRKFSFILMFSFSLAGCLTEEFNTDLPKVGLEQIQLHNFNLPVVGGLLEGTAPDIYYFEQKGDGSYVFMLTSTNYKGFQTNWETEYVLVTADARGVIQKTEVMKLPVTEGFKGNFDYVFEAGVPPPGSPLASNNIFMNMSAIGPNYASDDKGFLYYTPINGINSYISSTAGNLFFNLRPETGQAEYFAIANAPGTVPAQVFRTSDGGFITVGALEAPDYNKFSASGTLEFKQPMKYWEARPAYVYLTSKNGDHYFLTTYLSEQKWFAENTAKSFFYIYSYLDLFMPKIDVEIRFGPGKTQKAHRFNRRLFEQPYEDYVDVPFEVWDVTNNQQLMAGFRDQGLDGVFNLIPMNFIGNADTDPNYSKEDVVAFNVPYSTTPDQSIITFGAFSLPSVLIFNYLTDGATWNPSALPPSTFSLKTEPKPGTQILKVNANGSSVVKDNYTLGSVPFQNMFKAVPYLNGSAVLINVPSRTVTNPATQLVILDADFKQTAVLNMTFNEADRSHQLDYNKEKDRIFYARLTNNPNVNSDNVYKGSILLSVISDNTIKQEKYLDEFIPFQLEKYRITPTMTGGVAIAAWVLPTKDTRDLLFFELDENLELVNR